MKFRALLWLSLALWSPAAADVPDSAAKCGQLIALINNSPADGAKALKAADECIAKYPSDTDLLVQRAGLYHAGGDDPKAIAEYTRIIKLDPKADGAWGGRGELYLYRKDYKAALADLNAAIKLEPEATYLALRGDVYRVTGDSTKARADYDKALAHKGMIAFLAYGRAFFGRGALYSMESKYDLAIAEYTKAIETEFQFSRAYAARANVHVVMGNHDAAIADYTTTIANDPKDTLSLESRASLYSQKGDTAKAIADYRALQKLDPANVAAKEALAKLAPSKAEDFVQQGRDQWMQNKPAEAIRSYTEAIRINPKLADAYAQRGTVQREQKAYPAALEDYKKAISLDPKLQVAYGGRAAVHSATKDFKAALADYEKALALGKPNDPDSVSYLTGRGVAHAGLGNDAKAMADWAKAAEILTKAGGVTQIISMPHVHFARARYYASKNKLDLAKAEYKAGLAIDHTHVDAKAELAKLEGPAQPAAGDKAHKQHFDEGRRLGGEKKYDEAIAAFSACIKVAPTADVAPCYGFRAVMHGMKGDLPTAQEEFKKALVLSDKDHEIYMLRGMMYGQLRKKDEAIADFREVLKAVPNHPGATRALKALGGTP